MDFEEEEDAFNEAEAHRYFAVNLFNRTWDLIDKPDRTQEDNDLMIHSAHTSAYHWLNVGNPVNFQRSAWQLARVYTILNDKHKSLHFARKCYDLTTEHELKDFDLAFAFEAMARAYALNGMSQEHEQFKKLALEASEHIEEPEDRDAFLKDIATGPWFGL